MRVSSVLWEIEKGVEEGMRSHNVCCRVMIAIVFGRMCPDRSVERRFAHSNSSLLLYIAV